MRPLIIFILFLQSIPNLYAQIDKSSDLFRILKTRDSILFNIGFNTCDIKQFENIVSENFEFYHDQAGFTNTKLAFIQNIKSNVCNISYTAKRVLDEKSLVVYPLENNGVIYGAIQQGVHSFYAIENGKNEHLTSIANFTHIWMLENGNWRLSRGLSYNHRSNEATDTINKKLLFIDETETEKWLVKNRIPALGIGYIKGGKIEQIKVYGELEKGKSAPDNAIFNVASLTKPITALVALKLVNAGKWNLDEPIYTYWTDPDIANDPRTKKLTTRHILSHQAGFANWRYKNVDNKLAFEFEPGTKYQYSGEGFEYLRKALENKFHNTLDQLASEYIFVPLQMNDTRFFWDKKMDESRFAKWHDGNGNLHKTYKNTSANAADDLLTTVEDYSKFMVHIMNGAGLNKDLYQQMISNQVIIKNNKYFGLGWWVDQHIGNREFALVHGGDDKGVHTIAFILPQSKQGLVIFTNCDNGTDIYTETVLSYLGELGQGIIDVETK